MEPLILSFKASFLLWSISLLYLLLKVSANAEGILILISLQLNLNIASMIGDALIALKANLFDPNGVFQSWDPTLHNPCNWFHVTCDNYNSVTHVALGNASLMGQLVPQLGQLPNLKHFSTLLSD
ncbi:hypothetical protein VNO77_05296 [Canavalia gladiata]|uniref:Leucine-rich repeat-containing N-terminal plant-type domain-containing protein n=1 Tax=Canavalia gladiata TaxID=3824 RepID=A0AAN9MY44_CANGL